MKTMKTLDEAALNAWLDLDRPSEKAFRQGFKAGALAVIRHAETVAIFADTSNRTTEQVVVLKDLQELKEDNL